MAKIKIQRTNEIQIFYGKYFICIDGKIIGKIGHGKTKEFEVTSGRHTIIARIDWRRSPELTFDCNDNDTKTFSVGGFKYSKWVGAILLGLIALIIILITTMIIQKRDINNLMFVAIPIFILLVVIFIIVVYYSIIRWNKYLQLTELNPTIESKAI